MAAKKLKGDRHFTEIESTTPGLREFRRMTADEIDRFNKSKTGKVKVQPTDVKAPPEVVAFTVPDGEHIEGEGSVDPAGERTDADDWRE